MPYVSIEWSDIRDSELLKEVEDRYWDEEDSARLLKKAKEDDKINLFLKVKDRFSLFELEEMFKDPSTQQPVPKEQLSLL